jgi:hypothetical protein
MKANWFTFSLGIALTMAICHASQAAVVSVNGTDGGSSGASAGNTAGAVLAGYWEEIAPSGAALGSTNLNNLRDDSGAASGVTLVQSDHVGGWWNEDAYPTGFSGTFGNDMYGNFHDTDFAYTYTFGNVNAGVGTLYDVYLYSARGFANTGVTQFDVNGETKFLVNENTVGDYVESGWSSQALAEANMNSGNYVRFQNVSLDTLVVGINGLEDLTNGGVAGSVAGIQLVTIPEPATGLLAGLALAGLAFGRRRRS